MPYSAHSAVIARVKQVIDRERHRLPSEAKLGVIYDRSELAARVEHTLLRAVAEEIAVVALVVLLFLLHFRSAAVPMITLPLVVLLTFAAMRVLGVPATVMSLGGMPTWSRSRPATGGSSRAGATSAPGSSRPPSRLRRPSSRRS